MLWETFSDRLTTAGLIMTGVAVAAFLVDLMCGKQMDRLAWPHAFATRSLSRSRCSMPSFTAVTVTPRSYPQA